MSKTWIPTGESFFPFLNCLRFLEEAVLMIAFRNSVPSQAPRSFSVTAKTSTSIEASWQLPPQESWNGIITGFKLFYKKKGSAGSPTMEQRIDDDTVLSKEITGLAKYTEYEFQVLAFTSVGDGPNSTLKSEKTKEDGRKLILIISKFKSHLPCSNYNMVLLVGINIIL